MHSKDLAGRAGGRPFGKKRRIAAIAIVAWIAGPPPEAPRADPRASILVYHRFGPVVSDSMTVRTSTFRAHLQYLKAHGHPVVPLRALVAWQRGSGPPLPAGAVVLTADDGHRSIYTDMLPLVREFGVPVTLFVYPSAISNASYAMTWPQLRDLHATGLFDIQSHTYWHPNFAVEKRRLSPEAYRAFVTMQLMRPIAALEARLGLMADMIAWPFGIYDEELLETAAAAGYVAGLTIERRLVAAGAPVMALPRFLVTDAARGGAFAAMLPPAPGPRLAGEPRAFTGK